MSMKFLKTSRLFYKKWPFKVECYLKGASRIKYNGVEDVIDWCMGVPGIGKGLWWEDKSIDKSELLQFATAVQPYLDKEIQIRVEGAHFNIFCKDQDLLDNITHSLAAWVTAVYEPSNDDAYNYLLDNPGNKVLCEQYPWDGFQYKIILREKMPEDAKMNFLNWIQRYPGKIRIAGSSLNWIINNKRWMQDPFIYVKDQGTLTMTLLFLGNYCKKTHQYILKSSINTPCPH